MRGNTFKRDILWHPDVFRQSSMICIGHHVGRHTPSNMAAKIKLLFACILIVIRLTSYTQMYCKHLSHHLFNIWNTWSLSAEFVFKFISFLKSLFGHAWPAMTFTHFKKMVWVWKTKSHIILFEIWPNRGFSEANSYNFHIFRKNDITWPLYSAKCSIIKQVTF